MRSGGRRQHRRVRRGPASSDHARHLRHSAMSSPPSSRRMSSRLRNAERSTRLRPSAKRVAAATCRAARHAAIRHERALARNACRAPSPAARPACRRSSRDIHGTRNILLTRAGRLSAPTRELERGHSKAMHALHMPSSCASTAGAAQAYACMIGDGRRPIGRALCAVARDEGIVEEGRTRLRRNSADGCKRSCGAI